MFENKHLQSISHFTDFVRVHPNQPQSVMCQVLLLSSAALAQPVLATTEIRIADSPFNWETEPEGSLVTTK